MNMWLPLLPCTPCLVLPLLLASITKIVVSSVDLTKVVSS